MSEPKVDEGALNQLRELMAGHERNGWNAAINAAREAMPSTAENPNEDAYQRGRFDGIMEYGRALRVLYR